MSAVPIPASQYGFGALSTQRARRVSRALCVLATVGLLLPACGNGEDSTVWDSPPPVSESGEATVLEEVAPVEVDYQPLPTVEVDAVIDATSGVDVRVTTTGFSINPSRTPTDPVDGEGHFILYVDGEGRRRVYENTFHIEISAPGDHEIRIVLAGNDRAPLTVEGEPIEAVTTVTVPDPDAYFEPTLGDSQFEMEAVVPS